MSIGYIYLEKKIQDHWLYKDKPFNKAMAWIDMLMIADHTTHQSLWRGRSTEFKRGDVNLSIAALAKRWGWTRGKATRFISNLEADGMVNVKRTPNRTVITIVNYELYQDKQTSKRTPKQTSNRTSNRTSDDTHLINNKENISKKRKEEAESPLDEAPAFEEEEPPVPGAVRMPNGGWNYMPELDEVDDE